MEPLATQPGQYLAPDDGGDETIKHLVKNMRLVTQRVAAQQARDGPKEDSQKNLLRLIIQNFEHVCLGGGNIHVAVQRLDISTLEKTGLIQSYYAAVSASGLPILPQNSALLGPGRSPSDLRSVYAVFGGQGINGSPVGELRNLFRTYQTLIQDTLQFSEELILSLCTRASAPEYFSEGLTVINWLNSEEQAPSKDYLSSAPISFPLIGLLQLASYEVTCKTLGLHPGELRDSLSGTTGHSQGLIVAAIIAMADDWETWRAAARVAITILFWLGLRIQQAFRPAAISSAMLKDSEKHGEGLPTPMLQLRGFDREQVEAQISKSNKNLRSESRISLSLTNGPRNFVVSGSPMGLYGLNRQLRKLKQSEQSQIAKTSRYLPVSAPFHGNCLDKLPEIVLNDLKGVIINASDLKIPLYCTKAGSKLNESEGNIVPALLRMVASEPLDWVAASAFPGATHIVDFGPGGVHGIGSLTHANKKGQGITVILATTMQGASDALGYQPDMFVSLDKAGERST